MSVILSLESGKQISETKEKPCHLMPCHIHYNGQMPSRAYLESNIKESAEENVPLKWSFRGRPLLGQQVQLPKGFQGVLFEESEKNKCADVKTLRATRCFSEFTLWNLDQVPSNCDKCIQALQWAHISSAVHRRIQS